jgi:dTDP-4-amino-4,6-dideoxygalactose transaminase
MILCGNPHAQYLAHQEEIDDAIRRVLDKGRYILGDEVKQFEQEFAQYIGVDQGIGVGSGTEALHIGLAACGVGPGDEVITVSHTAVATVSAIEMCGATPVFVDIEPDTFTLDPERLQQAITNQTKAIVPVHLYGQPADLSPILDIARSRNIVVLEDCAQAHGAVYRDRKVGAWGDIACFSFYPTKNLGAIGDGGMVVTSNGQLADRVRLLREYGWAERYISHIPGWNSRLDEIQAAILRVKLKYLDRDNQRRIELAAQYEQMLAGVSWLRLPATRTGSRHVFHLYVIRCMQRDALQRHLNQAGVNTLVHYPCPVHLQPAYQDHLPLRDGLHVTEAVAKDVLSLPLYPELEDREQASVVQAILSFR